MGKVIKWTILPILSFSAVAFFLTMKLSFIEYDDRELEKRIFNLSALEQHLVNGATPEKSDVTFSISESGFSEVLSTLVGIESNSKNLEGVKFEVTGVSANFSTGEPRASLSILASHESSPFKAKLTTSTVLLLTEISDTKAVYSPLVENIQIKIKSGVFSYSTWNWASKLLASNATKSFTEELRLTLPLSFPASIKTGFSKNQETDVEDGIGSYIFNVSMREGELLSNSQLKVIPPIIADKNLWVLATLQEPSPSQTQPPSKISPEELNRLISRIEMLTKNFPKTTGDVLVKINRSAINKAVGEFNGLPQEYRRVTAQLISREGHIAKEMDHDDVLGQGGYYANFQGNDSARGKIDISELTATWNDSGLTLSTGASIEAHADIKMHIDPYIGGGFPVSFRINGKSHIPINIALKSVLVEQEGMKHTAFIGATIECRRFPITLLGGGEIKFGVTVHELIGDKQPEPSILLSSRDIHLLKILSYSDDGEFLHSEYWSETYFIPVSVTANESGYSVTANISTKLHEGSMPSSLGDKDSGEVQSLMEAWQKESQGRCPAKDGIIVHFAGQDFGPNNEIVKIIKGLGDAANKTGENIQITIDRIDTVLKDPSKTPEVIGDALEDIGESTGKAFQDAAQAVDKAAKEVGKVLDRLNPF